VLERRKPTLLLRLPGAFMLRFAERQLKALLFQLPPRMTRFAAISVVAHTQKILSNKDIVTG
jgi:hypothetical protein